MQESVIVINEVNAKIGDWVEIELADSTILSAAFVLYVVPLVAFLAAMLASYGILTSLSITDHAEAISAAVGLAAVVIAYIWIKSSYEDNNDNKSKYLSTITRIIESEHLTCNHHVKLEDTYDEL